MFYVFQNGGLHLYPQERLADAKRDHALARERIAEENELAQLQYLATSIGGFFKHGEAKRKLAKLREEAKDNPELIEQFELQLKTVNTLFS